MIKVVTERIEDLQNRLMSKAKKNVKKRNRIKKAAGICQAVANVLPVLGPVGTAVGGAISTVLSSGIVQGLAGQYGVDYSDAIKTVGNKACDEDFLNSMGTALTDAKNSASDLDFKGLGSAFNSIYQTAKPLIESVQNVSKLLSKSSTPSNEVEAEYNRLIAASAEWRYLKGQIDSLNLKKEELLNHLNQVFSGMTNTMSELSNDVLALDALRRDVFTGNSKRDLNAMLYMEKMEQRAKNRLLKYHYYLRKAYEYRLLKPYEGDFNLVGMFERFESLGMALDGVINETAYTSLGSIFRDVVSEMAEKIVTEYSTNNPEQSSSITLVISKDQLKAINAEEGITLNFHDMGIFASDEENVRIVNLEIEHLETHVEGNVGASGHMDLNITHSGISTFRKDGNLYWFDHRSRNVTSPHTWGIRYDAVTNKTTNIQPSAASTSLIRSLINTDDVMLFSRPSAWSDVALTKKVHSSGGANVVIDSLVIKLDYDFTRRLNDIRNIDITVNEGLLPYIACSVEDISGRSNGNGRLYRSYTKSSQPVTFTAVDKYESFWFKNWTDRAGNIVSNETAMTVDRLTDQFYTANYEYHGPILSVPDTIYVGNEGSSFTVNVRNIGIGDEEMDWYVTDSLSSFVHIDGPTEGIDDGTFTFTFEPNPTGEKRVDFIEIIAPESYVMSKTICIVQRDEVIEATDIMKLDNAIYIEKKRGCAGQVVDLPVKLKNQLTANGCSFRLTLPEGFTLKKDGDGDVVYTLSSRARKMSLTFKDWNNGTYDFALTPSTSTASISDTDGTFITLKMVVPETAAEGDYKVELTKNLIQSNVDGVTKDFSLANVITVFTVSDYVLGDVNGDGSVTPSDAIMILYHYFQVAQNGFNELAADINGDGAVTPADAIEALYLYFGSGSNNARMRRENEQEPQ